jgi:hypothetical protein
VPPIPNPGHQLEASAGPARTVPSQPSDNWLVTPNVASLTAGLTSTRRLRRAIPISSSTACSHCNGNSKPRRPSRAMATEGPRRDPHFPRSKRERPRPSRVSMRVRSRSYCLSFSAGASTFRKTSATGRSGNDCSPNCKGGLGRTQPRHMGEQEGHAIEAVTSLLNAIGGARVRGKRRHGNQRMRATAGATEIPAHRYRPRIGAERRA